MLTPTELGYNVTKNCTTEGRPPLPCSSQSVLEEPELSTDSAVTGLVSPSCPLCAVPSPSFLSLAVDRDPYLSFYTPKALPITCLAALHSLPGAVGRS